MVWLRLWVRSPPASPKHKQKYYDGILSRNFKYSCTDCIVHVWLSYTDCGCLESATRMECDSNPVLQTNLGLTSLYSLLLFGWIVPVDWLPIGTIFAYGLSVLKKRLAEGYIWGDMVVTHHFLSRDRALGFNSHVWFSKIFSLVKINFLNPSQQSNNDEPITKQNQTSRRSSPRPRTLLRRQKRESCTPQFS